MCCCAGKCGDHGGRLPIPDYAASADAVSRRIAALEARLHDYARQVEAESATRTAALRVLIDEADAAAARLAAAAGPDAASLPFDPSVFDSSARAARLLRQAGYSESQVVKLLERQAA